MKKFLFLFLISHLAVAQTFTTVPVVQNGSNNNRINIAVLGDGFTTAQQSNFQTAATNAVNYILNKSPYAEYRNYFNAYAVQVISAESGAKHPGTATDVTEPQIPVANPNNYFGSSFDTSGVHRLLYSFSSNAINQVLAANVPDYDIALILVNSTEYGGAGGVHAFASLNTNSNEIVVHELGHSFANLADEYWYAATGESPNKTQVSDPATIKWKNWLNTGGTGIYPYSEAGVNNWYRPHQSCNMRYLNQQFCPVCKERIIERIHGLVSAIDSYSPANAATVDGNVALNFNVTTILPIPNTLVNTWTLNSTPQSATGNTFSLTPAQLNTGNNTLVFSVTDNTALVRTDNHASLHISTVTWTIYKDALGVSDISAEKREFAVFPNPATEILYIRGKQNFSENVLVEMFDLSGKMIPLKAGKNSHRELVADVSGLLPGNYLLKVSDGGNTLFFEKIIIQ